MYISEVPFDQLYIGRPVKSKLTLVTGFIEWLGKSETDPWLTDDTVCVSWDNGRISEFPHANFDKVIDLEHE